MYNGTHANQYNIPKGHFGFGHSELNLCEYLTLFDLEDRSQLNLLYRFEEVTSLSFDASLRTGLLYSKMFAVRVLEIW